MAEINTILIQQLITINTEVFIFQIERNDLVLHSTTLSKETSSQHNKLYFKQRLFDLAV